MTEEQLKQEIYNVLNTHNPTTCTDKPCKAVTALMSLFTKQLELAKIEANISILKSLGNWWYTCDLAPSGSATMDRIGVALSELTKQKEELGNSNKYIIDGMENIDPDVRKCFDDNFIDLLKKDNK